MNWKISLNLSSWHILRRPLYVCKYIPDWVMFDSFIRSGIFFSVHVPDQIGIMEKAILTEEELNLFRIVASDNPTVIFDFAIYVVNPDKLVEKLVERWQELIDDPSGGWNRGEGAAVNWTSEFIAIFKNTSTNNKWGLRFQDVTPYNTSLNRNIIHTEGIKMSSMVFSGTFLSHTEQELRALETQWNIGIL